MAGYFYESAVFWVFIIRLLSSRLYTFIFLHSHKNRSIFFDLLKFVALFPTSSPGPSGYFSKWRLWSDPPFRKIPRRPWGRGWRCFYTGRKPVRSFVTVIGCSCARASPHFPAFFERARTYMSLGIIDEMNHSVELRLVERFVL